MTYKGDPVNLQISKFGGTSEEPNETVLFIAVGGKGKRRSKGSKSTLERRLKLLDKKVDKILFTDNDNITKEIKSFDKSDFEIKDKDLAEGKLFEASIKFIDYVTVDQDEFKAQYDKHYDDYGNDGDFVEEFGRDFLSPNIKAINQYYGAKVSADDVIEDFFSAGGISNISSKEEFETWLDKNREFYI